MVITEFDAKLYEEGLIEEGIEKGVEKRNIELARTLKKRAYSIEHIAAILEIDVTEIEAMLEDCAV